MKRIWAFLAVLLLLAGLVPAALAQGPATQPPVPETTTGTAQAGGNGPESLSGSFVAFDPSVGGDSCYLRGAAQTFCFRAESFTNDWEYVYNVWERFPADWTVNNVYVLGTPSCDGGGSWGTFSWSFQTPPYEVNINHPRYHANPDHCTAYYCFDVTSGGPGDPNPALESWYWDGDGYGSPPHNPCSNDNYTPAGQVACDEAIQPQASIPRCLMLTPPFQSYEGCACEGQGHYLTAANFDVLPVNLLITYTVVGPGTGGGPINLGPIPPGGSQEFPVNLRLSACSLPSQTITVTVEAVALETGNTATATIVKHAITWQWGPGGWQLMPIGGAAPTYWQSCAVGMNPAAPGEVGYQVGGMDTAGNMMANLQMYDPAAAAWAQLAPQPHAVFGSVASWIAGKLYVSGGFESNGFVGTTDLQVYDPGTDLWDNVTVPDIPAAGGRGGASGGKGTCHTGTGECHFHVGGSPSSQFAATTLETWEYDPVANVWTQLDNRPAGSSPDGFMLGGGVGCMGYVFVGGDYRGFPEFYRLDATQPAGSQWTQLANIPASAGKMTVAMVCKEMDSAVYLIGGDSVGYWGDPYNPRVYRYDIAADTWSQVPYNLNVGLLGSCGLHFADRLWTFAGTNGAYAISPPPHEALEQIICPPCDLTIDTAKMAPPAAAPGEVISYTLVFAPSAIEAGMIAMDPLPPNVVYADNLTYNSGYAWYEPADNTVYWTPTPPPLKGAAAPMWTAPAPSGAEPSSLLALEPSNVSRGPGVTSAPTQIQGTVFLDQQPNQSNGIFSDETCDSCGRPQVLAENFSLATPQTIIQVVLWGGYYSTDTPIDPDDITVIFHQDAAGLPGAVIAAESPVAYERVQTGVMLFGVHEWMHTLTLATPVPLGPGIYWVEIYNNTGWGNDDYFWEVGNPDTIGNGLPDAAVAFEAPGGTWETGLGTDLAMQLIGAYPQITFNVVVNAPCGDLIQNEGLFSCGMYADTFAAKTQVVGEPDIVVEPMALWDALCPDSTDAMTLTICNAGNCPLWWMLLEVTPSLRLAGSMPFVPVSVAAKGSAPEGLTVSSPAPEQLVQPVASAHPEAVLWDQPLSVVDQDAYVDQEFPDYPNYSSFLADDFVNGTPWLVNSIFVPGDLWNGATDLNLVTSLTWQIYADNAGVPAGDPSGGGNPPVWTLALPPGDPQVVITTGSGGYPSDTTLNLATPIVVPPGTWWLVFYPTAEFGPWGQYGRQPADTTNGYVGQFINPGGGFGLGTDWQDWTVLGPPAPLPDIAFRLEGTAIQPGDIPWLSESPITGTVPAGGCQPVDVTFDSTDLLPADYTGDLLIASNDPDTPTVTVPVTMTVEVPVTDTAFTWDPLMPVGGEEVTFYGTATGTLPFTYTWEFSDGGTGMGQQVTHTFAMAGSFVVTLTVVNDCGDDMATDTVTVTAPVYYIYLPLILKAATP